MLCLVTQVRADLTPVPVCGALSEPQSYAGAIRRRAY